LSPDVIISKQKCTKFDFGWGCTPGSVGEPYSAPLDPLAGFKGQGRRRGEGRGSDGRIGEGRREKRREGKEEGRGG